MDEETIQDPAIEIREQQKRVIEEVEEIASNEASTSTKRYFEGIGNLSNPPNKKQRTSEDEGSAVKIRSVEEVKLVTATQNPSDHKELSLVAIDREVSQDNEADKSGEGIADDDVKTLNISEQRNDDEKSFDVSTSGDSEIQLADVVYFDDTSIIIGSGQRKHNNTNSINESSDSSGDQEVVAAHKIWFSSQSDQEEDNENTLLASDSSESDQEKDDKTADKAKVSSESDQEKDDKTADKAKVSSESDQEKDNKTADKAKVSSENNQKKDDKSAHKTKVSSERDQEKDNKTADKANVSSENNQKKDDKSAHKTMVSSERDQEKDNKTADKAKVSSENNEVEDDEGAHAISASSEGGQAEDDGNARATIASPDNDQDESSMDNVLVSTPLGKLLFQHTGQRHQATNEPNEQPAGDSDDEVVAIFLDDLQLSGWEQGWEPEKIINITKCDDLLMALIKWRDTRIKEWVPADVANELCPELVIEYYEDRIVWGLDENGDDEPSDQAGPSSRPN